MYTNVSWRNLRKRVFFCRDFDEFMNDLEEDKEYRQNINIYKKPNVIPVDVDDMEDALEPRITLEEMLDDLVIDNDDENGDDVEMA